MTKKKPPCTSPHHKPGSKAKGRKRSPVTGVLICGRCNDIERYGYCACGAGAKTPEGLCEKCHNRAGRRGTCNIDGCAEPTFNKASGLCRGHYYGGHFGTCNIDGCAEPTFNKASGACRGHHENGPEWSRSYDSMAPEAPGLVYVVWHEDLRAAKIGIGAAHARRVSKHAARGWEALRVDTTTWTVKQVTDIETKVLGALRRAGVPEGATAADMPQYGHTETFPATRDEAVALARWIADGAVGPVPIPVWWTLA
jgi:hypothetical protein